MKRVLKFIVLALFILFAGIQFVRPDKTNPPVVPTETLESSSNVPPEVASILSRSCADCHTNTTHYPWYSQIAPVSWLLADHIREGRRQLNFSVWNTYDDDKKSRRLDEICEQAESGEMPLSSYLVMHTDAALREGDAQILCSWAATEKAKIPG